MISDSVLLIQTSSPMHKARHIILSRFLRFASVGAVGTIIQYVVLIGFAQVTDLSLVIASAVGFILGAFMNYSLNYRYTFRSTKNHREAMIKFMTVALAGLIINTCVMGVAEHYALHYLFAQVFATGLVLVWNFSVNLLWAFRE